jgi:3-dehydroquinate synthase
MSNAASAQKFSSSTFIERTIQFHFPHRIFFTENLFQLGNPLLADILRTSTSSSPVPKALIVLDESLHRVQPTLQSNIENYFAQIRDVVEIPGATMVMEGGERLKNSYFHVSEIHSAIDRYNLDRHSYVIAIGGGALLDVTGLAAATAHRGLRLIRIPSTTLSQADSGVGVKNGINAFGKKNFIGTFAIPVAVINDFALLYSLSPRDRRAGYSEAVKVACIKDAAFFRWIEQNAAALKDFQPDALRQLIHRSAEIHVNHIANGGDPFELGSARPLDFGHWSAHKLEQLSEYSIRHGEAVAIGIALDVVYCRLANLLAPAAAERILVALEALGFELCANELFNVDASGNFMVLKGLEEFRLHLGGHFSVTLLRDIGQSFQADQIDHTLVAAALRELRARSVAAKSVRAPQ